MSKYTNLIQSDIENGVTADFILILGPDEESYNTHQLFFKNIIEISFLNNLKYVILGDGKNPPDLQEIGKLPKSSNLFINAHGGIIKDQNLGNIHAISLENGVNLTHSLEFVKKIQKTTSSKNIIFCACYAGKIINELKTGQEKQDQLDEGTLIFTPSSAKEISLTDDNGYILSHFIEMMQPGKNSSLIHLSKNCINSVPETMILAYQSEDKNDSLKIHKIRRRDRLKNLNFNQVESFCEYLQSEFDEFIIKTTQNENCKQLKLNFEEYKNNELNNLQSLTKIQNNFNDIQRFKDKALINYIMHKDTDILKNLLSQTDKQQSRLIATQLLVLMLTHHFPNDSMHSLLTLAKRITHHKLNIFYPINFLKISILDSLIQTKNLYFIEVILKKNPNQIDENGLSPLDHLLEQNCFEIIEKIISLPGIILSPISNQNNRLKLKQLVDENDWFFDALREGNITLIRNLLNSKIGIDVNAEEEDSGKTPIMIVSLWNDLEIAKLLIEHGAKLNATDSIEGETALLIAVQQKNIKIASYLIAQGAEPNQANSLNGKTPLHQAVIENSLPLIKLLLKANADIHQQDFASKTPYDYLQPNQKEIKCYLEDLLQLNQNKEKQLVSTETYVFPTINIQKIEIVSTPQYSELRFIHQMNSHHHGFPKKCPENVMNKENCANQIVNN